jgi:hypothetical protein
MKFFNWLGEVPASPILVVEVEAPAKLEEMTPELAQQVQSLQYHPGFLYLMNKSRFQRSLLRAELEKKRQATLADSEFIKSGIAWSAWWEDQLRQAVGFGKRQSSPQQPLDHEREAFAAIQRELEIVGA